MENERVNSDKHPGVFIREHVLPTGMSVKEAASLMKIGRSSLSNLLNGNKSLTIEMARLLEHTFGANFEELMAKQAAFESTTIKIKKSTSEIKPYIPPFLQIKANDIEEWGANNISARQRLPVLIRTLINSSGIDIISIEFPGNDDSQRKGPDGRLNSSGSTPWIPSEESIWQFGVASKTTPPKVKADKDYQRSVDQFSDGERKALTFVFVTTRRWKEKAQWQNKRQKEMKWKNVRVYDASNLEEWLEQSIPGQVWLANEMGIKIDGVQTLDQCWREWVADCEPTPNILLFNSSVLEFKNIAKEKLLSNIISSLLITADSTSEGLAFIHCLFSETDSELFKLRDKVVVFRKPDVLPKLIFNKAQFIAVSVSKEVDSEIAQYKQVLRSISIYPNNTITAKADIFLGQLSLESFTRALQEMEFNHDEIQLLNHESGRSLTVLRRRLSKSESIKSPKWSENSETAAKLIPMLFAGTWNYKNAADRQVLESLSNSLQYEDIERDITKLRNTEDAPVWALGDFRGIISKIDLLFSIHKNIIAEDIERFLKVAYSVLSEEDPAIDLHENQRFAAVLLGKIREISSTLRGSISETLVLLAIHGNSLFLPRLGLNIEILVNNLIKDLLSPFTARKIESHGSNLPMFSEAAPETFLQLFENDIDSPESESMKLLKPSSGLFSQSPRVDLLWALENLAWSPKYIRSTVYILSKLSQKDINDNLANKPIASLNAIFRNWMPQTAAVVATRIKLLDMIIKEVPDIGWKICINQFNGDLFGLQNNHKPRWRPDGRGFGEHVSNEESFEFASYTLEKVIAWNNHGIKTIQDLVILTLDLDIKDQERIWNLILSWSKTASEVDKSSIREIIRERILIKAERLGLKDKIIDTITSVYNNLLPTEIILRHKWLFRRHWVELPYEKNESIEFDHKWLEQQLLDLRKSALREILEYESNDGIIKLIENEEFASVIGWAIPEVLTNESQIEHFIQFVLNQGSLLESIPRQTLIYTVLSKISSDKAKNIISVISSRIGNDQIIKFLTLCPFNATTWFTLNKMSKTLQDEYWKVVQSRPTKLDDNEFNFATDKLLEADRPRETFEFIDFYFEKVDPRKLFKILDKFASDTQSQVENIYPDSFSIQEAFKKLTDSTEISLEEMAGLEFKFLDVLLERRMHQIPNLYEFIDKYPENFVQAVIFAYSREDKLEDPLQFKIENDVKRAKIAFNSIRLMENLRIPGNDKKGEIDAKNLKVWIDSVQKGCKEYGRQSVGDITIGKLLSKAPSGDDKIWPCKPVRDVLESIINESVEEGLITGLYNKRGMYIRKPGGNQEREIAVNYRDWAEAIEYTHPKLSRALMKLVKTYEQKAEWQDTQEMVNRRLLS